MTERCDCDLCKIGAALAAMLKTLDDFPEIGESFYDDPISEIYNAIDENIHKFECLLTYQERMRSK